MVEIYRRDLLLLIERVRPAKGLRNPIECKHFFGGAAGYVDGRIFVTLTPAGLALKLPDNRRAALLNLGARPLRYFPKAPVKKEYVVLPKSLAQDDNALILLFAESVRYCLGSRRAHGPGANAQTKNRKVKAKRRRHGSRQDASPQVAAPMGTRISELLNLGPVSERQLVEVGIADADALRAAGALHAYARLKWRYPREVNVVALYALEGALTDTHWNRLPGARKEELRRFAAESAGKLKGKKRNPRRA